MRYKDLVEQVVTDGRFVESRLGGTYEVAGLQVRTDAGTLVHRKGINYRLGWMEFLQLVAGVYDPERIKAVAPNADHTLFSEQSAYGPRVRAQLYLLLDHLAENPTSRQAVLYVANRPEEACSSDMPCTETIQFLYRYGALETVVSMRSWDLIKGLAYDLVMFGGLAQVVANCLWKVGQTWVGTGELIVTAGSAHVYSSDILRVADNKFARWYVGPPVPTRDWETMTPVQRLRCYRDWAMGLVYSEWPPNGVPPGIKVVDHERMVVRQKAEVQSA